MNLALKFKILEKFNTQADFAKIVGFHESDVSRIIRGRRKLGEKEKQVWAEKLGSPVDELFADHEIGDRGVKNKNATNGNPNCNGRGKDE